MLGFTLSKLNLLLLVTATFAIIAYFMFGLTDVVIRIAAQQTVSAYAEKADHVIASDSLCFKTETTIPRYLSYFGGWESAKRFLYLMHVSRYPEEFNKDVLTSVILAISDVRDKEKLIAASRIDVNAMVIFYDWNPSEIDIVDDTAKAILLDPNSAIMRKDSLIIVKEVLAGENYLHIIACSSSGTCESNFQKVACEKIPAMRSGKKSPCIPCPE